jgi:hypothetical protein
MNEADVALHVEIEDLCSKEIARMVVAAGIMAAVSEIARP